MMALSQYGINPDFISKVAGDILSSIILFGLVSWIGGIFLLTLNRELYRFLEGYGSYNSLKLFAWFERRRYKNAVNELEKLDDEYRECYSTKKEFPAESRLRRSQVIRQLAEEFPDKEEYLRPTVLEMHYVHSKSIHVLCTVWKLSTAGAGCSPLSPRITPI